MLHTFTGDPDGVGPQAGLIMDAHGNLYGTTYGGGNKYGWGTAFELTPSGTETIIHTFSSSATAFPWGSLILDTQGNLYGTNIGNGGGSNVGSIFEITSLRAFKVRYHFGNPEDGLMPQGTLVEDGQGNLYGTTINGGAYGEGTVFKVAPTGVETVLHSFAGGSDGGYPYGGLVMDAHSNLYGTTETGGTDSCYVGCGTVFKITASGSKSTLYRFKAAPDGNGPSAGLILDAAGNLYGTTISGGSHGDGTVFKLTPGRVETVLYSFAGTDGDQPRAPLLMDAEGNLYGTTPSGGSGCAINYLGCGTVFKLTPDGTETVLYSFSGGADGWNPQAGLVRDSQGNLYGTAISGGDIGAVCAYQGCGTVFKLTP